MKSRWMVCVFALLIGCSEAGDTGGVADVGGDGVGGGTVACADNLCPCTAAGIRAAIAEGGGPFTFDCDGPTTVEDEAEIVINNDVILNGEGNLTVSGGYDHRVIYVGATATLIGMSVTRGFTLDTRGGGIFNVGTLTLESCSVSENFADLTRVGSRPGHGGGGIYNVGTLKVIDSTVSDNGVNRGAGAGIHNFGGSEEFPGNLVVINSTISGNIVDEGSGGGVWSETVVGDAATITLSYTTVSGNSASENGSAIANVGSPAVVVTKSIVDGDCFGAMASDGYNVERPGDTCGFLQATDQVEVGNLWLAVLRDNGGPTETHELLSLSVAIDVIPAEECVDADGEPLATDQRGEPRDSMCDVGAFEVQP